MIEARKQARANGTVPMARARMTQLNVVPNAGGTPFEPLPAHPSGLRGKPPEACCTYN